MEIQNAGLISDETEFLGSLSNNVYCLSYLHTLHSLWIQGVKCFILQICPQPTLIAKFPQAGSHEPTNTHLREAKSLDQDASSSYPFDIQAAKHLLSLSSTPSAVKNLAKNPSSSSPAQTQIQLTHQEHGGACQVSRTLPLHPHTIPVSIPPNGSRVLHIFPVIIKSSKSTIMASSSAAKYRGVNTPAPPPSSHGSLN